MTVGSKAAVFACSLSLSAASASAPDYRAEIMAQVIEPCLMHLARQQLAEGVFPEAMAREMMLLHRDELEKLVGRIDRQLESNPPAVARRQIYRVALRACLRQGAAVFRMN